MVAILWQRQFTVTLSMFWFFNKIHFLFVYLTSYHFRIFAELKKYYTLLKNKWSSFKQLWLSMHQSLFLNDVLPPVFAAIFIHLRNHICCGTYPHACLYNYLLLVFFYVSVLEHGSLPLAHSYHSMHMEIHSKSHSGAGCLHCIPPLVCTNGHGKGLN